MKRIFLAAALTAAMSTMALAADMPMKAAPTPAIAPAYDWTGFYLGIEGGGGRADTRHTNANNGATSGEARINGGLFGATYGYNFQSGSWLLGFEGDISWSGIKDHFTSSTPFCAPGLPCLTELRWLGTDRIRVGYVWDRLMLYGTAGVAYGSVAGTIEFPGFNKESTTRAAFVYGAGREMAFAQNWSAKIEYLRINDFGDDITYSGVERVSLKDVDIVRGGINYRFGGPLGR
jgi:outer membrane immunogenic protein